MCVVNVCHDILVRLMHQEKCSVIGVTLVRTYNVELRTELDVNMAEHT